MDQKTWLWRKRSSEKTIVANGEEEKPVPKEADLEISLKALSEKLASVVDECSAKDKLLQSYQKTADDAVADKNKAEEELRHLREELDKVLQQRAAANERLMHLNSAFKDCMEQLNHVRNEQDQRMKEAVMQKTKEFERAHKKLEEKLSEMNKHLTSANAETTYLNKALLVKDKLIEDLNSVKNQTDAEFEALMSRLDSTEKENAFLRYEFRTLEKELDLRNEELEYCRRSVEVLNKQHLENVKKIKKLEGDCQRLRALTRKRMAGPAMLATVRSDIDMQGGNWVDTRKKSLPGGPVTVYSPDNASKKLGLLMSQIRDLEKENEILKEFLVRKEEEILHYQKVKNLEMTTALVSEEKCGTFRDREMRLMDDFVEMEKLAIVAVDVPFRGSFSASDVSRSLSESSKEISDCHVNTLGNELALVENGDIPSLDKPSDWLQNITTAILEQHRFSKRSVDDLLGDVRMALDSMDRPKPSKLLPVSGYLTWKSPTPTPRSNSIQESSCECLQPDVNTSLSKIIELVGNFDLPCSEDCNPLCSDSKALPSKAAACKIHVFRWKNSELTAVVKEFLQSCNDLLEGKIDYERFIGDLSSTIGWIADNCVSYEDHSTVRDKFQKHLGRDGPGTALELECVQSLMLEMEKMHSVLQVEIKGLKNELNWIKTLENDPNLAHKLQQSQEIVASLQNEMEILKESRGMTEDQIENLKTTNEDLDTQLTVTKAKLSDVLQKLTSAEVELDNKTHCCEELEGTCLELQLQLESMTKSQYSGENGNQEELLQTGLEITKASAKLAECEETILKLGKQLKSLGSAKELTVVDRVLSITGSTSKKLRQRSSLGEMLSEDNAERSLMSSKELISMIDVNGPSSVSRTCSRNFSYSDGTTDKYLRMKKDSRTAKSGALVIVSSKKRGGGDGLLTRLLLRRKKGSTKNKSLW